MDRTLTDVGATEAMGDEVTRLRVWGTETAFALPELPVARGPGPRSAAERKTIEWMVGASETCEVQLSDPLRRVSRRHALLVGREAAPDARLALGTVPPEGARASRRDWVLRDAGSKNGLRECGVRRAEIALAPGTEVAVGGLTLVAEGPRAISLRNFLRRLLGWDEARAPEVDLAVRAVRLATGGREALRLRGEGDLTAIAWQLHRRVLGEQRPFVVCDPRRREVAASARAPASRTTAAAALAIAGDGTVCAWEKRLPRDAEALRAAIGRGGSARLVLCDREVEPNAPECAVVALPVLATRAGELDRIIVEYAADAIVDLDAKLSSFTPADREWVKKHEAASLSEIDKAVRRLVALREDPNLARAATRLGMTRVALSEWASRRPLPSRGR
ncbi:MAG TPA: FHA domain-containing protein [Kofleriaceae bacterium]|jgi:hypothetical protein